MSSERSREVTYRSSWSLCRSGVHKNHEEGDGKNHQDSVMRGGTPSTVSGGAEFMQGVFTAIEQVVRNTVQNNASVSKSS